MEIDGILKRALREPPSPEEALRLFKKSQSHDKLLKLIKVASRVRDDEVGRAFKFDGFVWPITPALLHHRAGIAAGLLACGGWTTL